jgi:hypothetical protein
MRVKDIGYHIPDEAKHAVMLQGLRLYTYGELANRDMAAPVESDVSADEIAAAICAKNDACNTIALALANPLLDLEDTSKLIAMDAALNAAAHRGDIKAIQAMVADVAGVVAVSTAKSEQMGERMGDHEKILQGLIKKMEKLADELETLYGRMHEEGLISDDTYEDLMEKKRLASLYPVGSAEWKKAQQEFILAQRAANKEAAGNAKTPEQQKMVQECATKTGDFSGTYDSYGAAENDKKRNLSETVGLAQDYGQKPPEEQRNFDLKSMEQEYGQKSPQDKQTYGRIALLQEYGQPTNAENKKYEWTALQLEYGNAGDRSSPPPIIPKVQLDKQRKGYTP